MDVGGEHPQRRQPMHLSPKISLNLETRDRCKKSTKKVNPKIFLNLKTSCSRKKPIINDTSKILLNLVVLEPKNTNNKTLFPCLCDLRQPEPYGPDGENPRSRIEA